MSDNHLLADNELDLALFLDSIGVKLPGTDSLLPDDFVVIAVPESAAAFLEAKDRRAVVLCYRHQGVTRPLSLFFLRGDRRVTFCHSTLLLDSYADGTAVSGILRESLQRFFSRGERLPGILEPSWADVDFAGQLDCRIMWYVKPEIKVIAGLLREKLGFIPELPCFPSVYFYNNPYNENLLEVALPELGGCREILVLGTGAGVEAIAVALSYGIPVDATDINPIAVANTSVLARRTGTGSLITAWASDGFTAIDKKYDAVLFDAPLATYDSNETDPNRIDQDGCLLRQVLAGVPEHLNPGGRMFLMSRPDITPYLPRPDLQWTARRLFKPKSSVAIHEIRCSCSFPGGKFGIR